MCSKLKHLQSSADGDTLVSDAAQKLYAEANYEYPVKEGAAIDPIIAALGDLEVDPTPLTDIAQQRGAASRLVDQVGFDQ